MKTLIKDVLKEINLDGRYVHSSNYTNEYKFKLRRFSIRTSDIKIYWHKKPVFGRWLLYPRIRIDIKGVMIRLSMVEKIALQLAVNKWFKRVPLAHLKDTTASRDYY